MGINQLDNKKGLFRFLWPLFHNRINGLKNTFVPTIDTGMFINSLIIQSYAVKSFDANMLAR